MKVCCDCAGLEKPLPRGRAALEHGQLMFEQETLLRLLQNLRRGGHTDTTVSKDMGAEAGALISVVGTERLPRNWAKRVAQTDDELLAYVDDEEQPEWQRRAVEAYIALNDVTWEIRERIAARDGVELHIAMTCKSQ